MRTTTFVAALSAAVAIGWVGRSVFSDEPKTDPMEAMKKLAEPGEFHARLRDALVGEWKTHVKLTMNGRTRESDGTASIKPILGGRFVEQVVASTFGGSFEARGWIGYDNTKKKIVGTWIDTMGTGVATLEGDEKESGKVWEWTVTYTGPMGTLNMRDVMTKVGPDELRLEEFSGDSTTPMLESRYKRAK